MFASEAVSHIERSIAQDRNRKISKADLITVQLDAAAIVAASVNDLMDELDIPWKNYISYTSFSRDIENFLNQVVSEYTAEYGKSTAESIALVLEYMLYECVVYSHETIKSVQKLRSVNGNAVILVVGLYHPLEGLSFTAGGKVIKIGEMVQEMIDTCPTNRPEKLAEYEASMAIVKEYTPQLITDEESIRKDIMSITYALGIELEKKNKGQVMKAIMPHFKGKADNKIVAKVVGEMLT
jgi:hypothetical protein